MALVQSLFININSSGNGTIPAGFKTASIAPLNGATFTITSNNNTGDGNGSNISPTFSSVYSFPVNLSLDGYDSHTITSISGSIVVCYYK
jgi:hypothetical protein